MINYKIDDNFNSHIILKMTQKLFVALLSIFSKELNSKTRYVLHYVGPIQSMGGPK